MPFTYESKKSGTKYYLHEQETESRGGKRTLRFFAKEIKDGAIDNVPEGYSVTENERTGMPMLKRDEAKKK